MDAAKRELYEESGAEEFSLSPLCDYWGRNEDATTEPAGWYLLL